MIFFYLSLVSYFSYVYLKSKKAMHMLQQNFYNESNRYVNWSIKNYKKSFLTIDLFGFLLIILSFFSSSFIINLLFFIFYLFLFIHIRNYYKNEQTKKPLVFTKRVKRLFRTVALFFILYLTYISLNFDVEKTYIYYLILFLSASLSYLLIYISWFINLPIEKLIYLYYKNKAVEKLNDYSPKIIGITGSYGKTSSKNILSDILNVKYRAFASPTNLNTALGLMRTVNNHLTKFDEIFIPEISACYVGEIKKTCSFIKPQFAIITKIGLAHLDTFKSEDNIQKTKFELVEALPKDGMAVLNRDDEKQIDYVENKLKNNCEIKWIGIENKNVDYFAKNIKYSNDGTSFDVLFKEDKKTINFNTKLLGKANVYNILAALAIAKKFELTYEQMQKGVSLIKPIKNRLELKKYNDVTIIDDAYNSNPIGSKMALDVLKLMPGKKIIVTPGMIELKEQQYELNKKFGEYISEACDHVILVGKNQTKPIYEGLIQKKYDKKNIFVINDVKEAFVLINKLKDKNTFVLLENDLPDLFNE